MPDHRSEDTWDDTNLRREVLRRLRSRPRYPLLDAIDMVDGDAPGAYCLFLAVPPDRRRMLPLDRPRAQLAVFGPVLDGIVPSYIGSGKKLSRLRRHVTTLDATEGLRPADARVSWLHTTSHGGALLGEAAAVDAWRPLLCQRPLAGFGSRQPGAGRPGMSVSGWHALVPSGRWASRPTMAQHIVALVEAAVRVSDPDAFEPRWDPIDPGGAA